MTTTTNYTIREYATGQAIGETDLTPDQFRRYEAAAQQPEGLIALDTIPGHVELSITIPGETTVYLD